MPFLSGPGTACENPLAGSLLDRCSNELLGRDRTKVGRWKLESQALFAVGLLSTLNQSWAKACWETPKMPESTTGFPGVGGAIAPILQALVAQAVKNLPAVRETRVQSLGQKDPLEKGMTTHSNILA